MFSPNTQPMFLVYTSTCVCVYVTSKLKEEIINLRQWGHGRGSRKGNWDELEGESERYFHFNLKNKINKTILKNFKMASEMAKCLSR